MLEFWDRCCWDVSGGKVTNKAHMISKYDKSAILKFILVSIYRSPETPDVYVDRMGRHLLWTRARLERSVMPSHRHTDHQLRGWEKGSPMVGGSKVWFQTSPSPAGLWRGPFRGQRTAPAVSWWLCENRCSQNNVSSPRFYTHPQLTMLCFVEMNVFRSFWEW